jgi:hypothetical protein
MRLQNLQRAHGHLASALIALGLEFHLLAFAEMANASALKRSGVNEHVIAAIVRRDESKTFLVIVEFYGAIGHVFAFSQCECT